MHLGIVRGASEIKFSRLPNEHQIVATASEEISVSRRSASNFNLV